MILYIPTNEAEGLYTLIDKFGGKHINQSIRYDLLQQIREQMPKKTTAVNINDLIEKKIKNLIENT